jgi:predicted MarR family transcription regulator
MRTLICGLLALVSPQAVATDGAQRCERYAEVRSIVQEVSAPASADEPMDLAREVSGALAGWLGEEWRA